jgi:type II secretory pathway pseudopilin PulG
VTVVLFLLAVAAAIALPALSRGTDALRMRTEVAGFCNFLRHAREQAVTRREAQQVDVDPEAHLLVLRTSGSESPRASRRLWPALRIEPDTPAALTVRFFPTGPATAAAYRIAGPAQRVWLVTVDPLTGRVTNRLAES